MAQPRARFRREFDYYFLFTQLRVQFVDEFIDELNQQLREKKVVVKLSPEARSWLAQRGFDRLLGARPMARLIQAKIKEPLAEKILFGSEAIAGEVLVELENNELSLKFPHDVS